MFWWRILLALLLTRTYCLVRVAAALFRRADPGMVPLDETGERDYTRPILPNAAAPAVDPTTDLPTGYAESQREQPGGFLAEIDIFDTWFTSRSRRRSARTGSPIRCAMPRCSRRTCEPQGPASSEPGRSTTIAKALLHENSVPWRGTLRCSRGSDTDPEPQEDVEEQGQRESRRCRLLDEYTADGRALLGREQRGSAWTRRSTRRCSRSASGWSRELFNAGKFVLAQEADVATVDRTELDRAFVAPKLRALAPALDAPVRDLPGTRPCSREVESFFWVALPPTPISSSAKLRAAPARPRGCGRAQLRRRQHCGSASTCCCACSRRSCRSSARRVWSWAFAAEKRQPRSIHARARGRASGRLRRRRTSPPRPKSFSTSPSGVLGARSSRRNPMLRCRWAARWERLVDRGEPERSHDARRAYSPTCSRARAATHTRSRPTMRSRMGPSRSATWCRGTWRGSFERLIGASPARAFTVGKDPDPRAAAIAPAFAADAGGRLGSMAAHSSPRGVSMQRHRSRSALCAVVVLHPLGRSGNRTAPALVELDAGRRRTQLIEVPVAAPVGVGACRACGRARSSRAMRASARSTRRSRAATGGSTSAPPATASSANRQSAATSARSPGIPATVRWRATTAHRSGGSPTRSSDPKDFALIELDAGVPVNAQMCHFGGPTAINSDQPTGPVVLHHYGNGLVLGTALPARSGVALGMPDADHVFAQHPAMPR